MPHAFQADVCTALVDGRRRGCRCIPGLGIPAPRPGAASRPRSGVWCTVEATGHGSTHTAGEQGFSRTRCPRSTSPPPEHTRGCWRGADAWASLAWLCWHSQHKGSSEETQGDRERLVVGHVQCAARHSSTRVGLGGCSRERWEAEGVCPSHRDGGGGGAYGAIGAVPRGARTPTLALPGSVFISVSLLGETELLPLRVSTPELLGYARRQRNIHHRADNPRC